jgi:hypothetical protein
MQKTIIDRIHECFTPLFDSTTVITQFDDILIVDMDRVCTRRYGVEGIDELSYELGRLGNSKIMVFLFRDGANMEYSGARGIIEKTIRQFNLTSETCYVYYPDYISIDNATVIDHESWRLWEKQINQHIKDVPPAEPIFTQHFAGLFARFNLYRLKLFRHLYDNYRTQSVLAFNTNHIMYSTRFRVEFADDIAWANTNLPVSLDTTSTSGWLRYQDALANIDNLYNQYFIEIVSETDPHSSTFFTEKTMKNFWLGKPFILYSGAGSLAYLRSKGYQTFGSVINESYDTMENNYDRMTAIKHEIDRLAQLPINTLQEMHQSLQPIFDHNRMCVKANILKFEPSSVWIN